MSVFDRYLEQAKDFARRLVRQETGTRRWATVTSVDPILITYDGPAPQGIIPPVVLGTPVTIGDRVRAHTIGDKTYITRANPDGPLTAALTVASGFSGEANLYREGNLVQVTYDISGPAGSSNTTLAALPSDCAPRDLIIKPASEWQNGGHAQPCFVNRTPSLQLPPQSGVTRRRGSVVYLRSI